jgi:hypothetical protein
MDASAPPVSPATTRVAQSALNVPVSVFFEEKIGGSQEGGAVFAFLNTPYSFRLVSAFAKMPDRRIQQCIVHLVEQVAARISAVVR